MWLNLLGFGDVLDRETRERMFIGAALVTAAGVVFLILGLAHLGRRGGRVSAAMLSITIVLSVVCAGDRARAGPPAAAARASGGRRRDRAGVHRPARDDADARWRLARLRSFRKWRRAGCPTWAAFSIKVPWRTWPRCGRHRPSRSGPRSRQAVIRFTTASDPRPSTARSAARRSICCPTIASRRRWYRSAFLPKQRRRPTTCWRARSGTSSRDRGARVGVIGWPLTQPAPQVDGFMISDAFHRLSEPEMNLDATPAVWPPELLADARVALQTPPVPDPVALVSTMGAPQPENDYDVRSDRAPVLADRVHLQLLNSLDAHGAAISCRALAGHRRRRASLSSLCRSVGVWRRLCRREPAIRPRAAAGTMASSTP